MNLLKRVVGQRHEFTATVNRIWAVHSESRPRTMISFRDVTNVFGQLVSGYAEATAHDLVLDMMERGEFTTGTVVRFSATVLTSSRQNVPRLGRLARVEVPWWFSPKKRGEKP